MCLEKIETEWGFRFPERHRQVLQDASDRIHDACDFLLLESEYKLNRLSDFNEWIHSPQVPDPWPNYLFAFASNGCGDYFAYDLLNEGLQIIYMDPDKTVEENLNKEDQSMHFESFDAWHEYKTRQK